MSEQIDDFYTLTPEQEAQHAIENVEYWAALNAAFAVALSAGEEEEEEELPAYLAYMQDNCPVVNDDNMDECFECDEEF